MKQIGITVSTLLVLLGSLFGQAQQTVVATNTSAIVPPLVNFSGTLTDVNGKPLSGTVGVTFLLYKESQGGSPLWLETQNVQPDDTGRYTVMLGSTSSTGLPSDIFVAGEAHWLGVQVQGRQQEEQPRVLLVSAPYALKAGDAETIGGLPPSAFVLAAEARASKSAGKSAPPPNAAVTGTGTIGYIPMWDTTSDIIDSAIFQKSSTIGIGTVTPAATLDVNGKTDIRDTLTLFPLSTDNSLAVNGTTFRINSAGVVTFVESQTFLGVSMLAGGFGVEGQSVNGNAVYGLDTATYGTSLGVYGMSDSSAGYGVEGSSPNVGVYGSGTGSSGYGVDGHGTYMGVKGVGTGTTGTSIGVYGQTSDTDGFGMQGASPNIGVYGTSSGSSSIGADRCCTGVWGDTAFPGNIGVVGTAENGLAGNFENNSATLSPAVEIQNVASGPAIVLATYGEDALPEGPSCLIYTDADLSCSGTIGGVAKIEGGARKVSLYAMQSAENWFEDAGSGQLSNGSASVTLDPTFAQTVNLGVAYHVFLTPNGDCKGLYVSQKSATSFEVHELAGGSSSVAFDYRIMAKRSGYENTRLADVTEQYQKIAQQHRLRQQRMHQHRAARMAEGTVAAVVAAPHKPTAAAVADTVPTPR